MAAPFWQAGNFYLPGDLVQPVTAPAPNNPQVTNGGFAGATGWTFSGSAAYTASGGYGGGGCVQLPGNQPDGVALNNAQLAVPVGATLTAMAMIQQGASVAGATAGWAEVRWYSATNVELSIDKGNVVDSGSGGAWHQSKVDAVCPAGAAYARAAIHLTSVADHSHAIFGDNLSVSGASAGLPNGLVYRAVQPESGTSGANEPAWPGILGLQVVDNDVIWEAVTTSRITWTASPRYVSGAAEPTWPTDIGSMVQDGTINWEAVSRRVEDERCPNSKVVAIVASKVFAVDKDIVKFCATANPLDWSTTDDAGYLPTGLQQANSNDMAVLQQYRANLVALNASSFQNWQVDPDPAAMAILDQMDGIGSVWPLAAIPVSNDLFYLSQLGVRTVGIANAAENLSAGDVGAPIDDLVREGITYATSNGSKVIGTYFPGAGQYWLAFPGVVPPPLVVAGDLPDGVVGDTGSYQYVVSGGTPPYDVEVVSGVLPPGASMNTMGLVEYSYTTRGSYSWVVSAMDSIGEQYDRPDSAVIGEANVWNSALVYQDYGLSNNFKTVTQTAGGISGGNQIAIAGRNSGKWYFEVQGAGLFENTPTGIFGIGPSGFSPSGGSLGTALGHGAGLASHGFPFKDSATAGPRISPPYPGNRRCMVAFDADTGKLWFGVAGAWVSGGNPATGENPFFTMAAGTYFPMVSLNQISVEYTLLTLPTETLYSPPAGFSRWLQL